MQQYHQLLQHILHHGESRTDRTGTGTISVFGYQMKFDLNDGFPLLTTKKIHTKSVIHELLWFLSGSTHVKYLQDNGVHIWDAWATEEQCAKFERESGNLGPIYSKQWTSFGDWNPMSLKTVAPRIPSASSMVPARHGAGKIQGSYEVVQEQVHKDERGKLYDRIRFLDTGYEYDVRRDQLKSKVPKDPYAANVCGIGYLGEPSHCVISDNLRTVWQHMLERCYVKTCKEYPYYGELGVTVCPRWLCFASFLEDVQHLLGYADKQRNPSGYHLDKDHFQSSCYSPETCVWIPKSLNGAYAHAKPFEAVSPYGARYIHISTGIFANAYGLSAHSISRVLRGDRPHHKGWKFRYIDAPNLRFSTPVNQIQNLVEDIKTNPGSRRLLVTAWNPIDATEVALPPCHTLFQFYVHDGTLSCQLYQRSADVFLGVPFNIASYSLLTHMIAQVCGLRVGTFIHTFGDAHIYSNHLDQVTELLSRDARPLPKLVLNPDVHDVFAFKYDDFTIEGYNPHPKIKAEVAV